MIFTEGNYDNSIILDNHNNGIILAVILFISSERFPILCKHFKAFAKNGRQIIRCYFSASVLKIYYNCKR